MYILKYVYNIHHILLSSSFHASLESMNLYQYKGNMYGRRSVGCFILLLCVYVHTLDILHMSIVQILWYGVWCGLVLVLHTTIWFSCQFLHGAIRLLWSCLPPNLLSSLKACFLALIPTSPFLYYTGRANTVEQHTLWSITAFGLECPACSIQSLKYLGIYYDMCFVDEIQLGIDVFDRKLLKS